MKRISQLNSVTLGERIQARRREVNDLVKLLNGEPNRLRAYAPDSSQRIRGLVAALQARDADAIARTMADYPVLKAVMVWESDGELLVFDDYRGKRPGPEAGMVGFILELIKQGTFDRLRQCRCGTWFYAVRSDKTACSHRCHQKQFEQTGAYRAHGMKWASYKLYRRDYMRWHYHRFLKLPLRKRTELQFPEWIKQARKAEHHGTKKRS